MLVFLALGSTACKGDGGLGGQIQLRVDHQTVSASINQAPLANILGELAKITPIRFVFSGDGANEKVSVQFSRLNFWQAIHLILKNNYVIESNSFSVLPESGGKSITSQPVIHILDRTPNSNVTDEFKRENPSQQNNTSDIFSVDQSGIAKLAKNVAEAESADLRVQALENLALNYAEGEYRGLVVQVFDKALNDLEPAVRKAAFQIATENSIVLSDRTLIDVAGNDSDPDIRLGTLQEVANRTNPAVSRAFLEKAQHDPDERVSQAATDLLTAVNKKKPVLSKLY